MGWIPYWDWKVGVDVLGKFKERWALGDNEAIEDWHGLGKAIGVWGFFFRKWDYCKRQKGKLQFGFGMNYKAIRWMKKVRRFWKGKWEGQ